MSTSPPGTRARRARMRQPCSRRYQQASVSAPRPRFSAASRFTCANARARGRRRACAGCRAQLGDFGGGARRRQACQRCVERSVELVVADGLRFDRRPDDDHDLALGSFGGVARGQLTERAGHAFLVELGDLADHCGFAFAELGCKREQACRRDAGRFRRARVSRAAAQPRRSRRIAPSLWPAGSRGTGSGRSASLQASARQSLRRDRAPCERRGRQPAPRAPACSRDRR